MKNNTSVNKVKGALCTLLTGILTATCTCTVHAAESEVDFTQTANHSSIFIIGENDDIVKSAVELVKTAKEERISLNSDIYARNNREMKVSDESKLEFINQFGYSDEQTIEVLDDITSSEVKLVFKREYNGKMHYCIYSFDEIEEFTDDLNSIGATVVTFNVGTYRYGIFIKDNRFHLARKWDPVNTHVYECDNASIALTNKIKQAIRDGKDIKVVNDDNGTVHVSLMNGSQREEFIFYNVSGKEIIMDAPIAINEDGTIETVVSEVEIVSAIYTENDEYTIFNKNGIVYIESAKYSSNN